MHILIILSILFTVAGASPFTVFRRSAQAINPELTKEDPDFNNEQLESLVDEVRPDSITVQTVSINFDPSQKTRRSQRPKPKIFGPHQVAHPNWYEYEPRPYS